MCKSHNPRVIDKCLRELIRNINWYCKDFTTVGACCGHGKYNISILIKLKNSGIVIDMCSGMVIPRKKRFYKRDKKGYYFIPEVVNKK